MQSVAKIMKCSSSKPAPTFSGACEVFNRQELTNEARAETKQDLTMPCKEEEDKVSPDRAFCWFLCLKTLQKQHRDDCDKKQA